MKPESPISVSGDLSGRRFGKLVVVGRIPPRDKSTWWRARCDCGGTKDTRAQAFGLGLDSCGCLLPQKRVAAGKVNARKHGLTGSRIASIYKGMIRRCYERESVSFFRYGGRGISVCDVWRNDMAAFASWAIANGYADGLQLDRRDNEAGYSPANCRWATPKEQAANRRPRRANGYPAYERMKSEWVHQHPGATPAEYQAAVRGFAERCGV